MSDHPPWPAVDEPNRRRLGRYLIQEEIGRGMMGVVYRALDPALGRTVALKVVQIAFGVPEDERALFEKRFLMEAQAAARLSHPGIVVVHDVGRDADLGVPYIALEYLEGRTLAQLTAGESAMEWTEAARIVAQLAEALHHAHAHGIVHRDVKPANVMVLPSGQAKLMDFGVAKLAATHLTSTGQFFGTPAYMAPEQLGGQPVDGRGDLFSLGAVLYRLLTGRDAFAAPSVAAVLGRICRYEPPLPSSIVPEVPAAVDFVVARALSKDPDRRFADGASFARALEEARAAPRAGTAKAVPWAAAIPRRLPGRRIVVGGVLVVAALAAAAIPWSALSVRGLAPAPPPARLAVDFEHPLRDGVLKVWIDDGLAHEEWLESRVVEDLKVFRMRKGRADVTLDVPSGERVVRLQVESDGFNSSRRIRGTFESGQTRRLQARVSGLLVKELSMWWEP